MSWTIRHRGTEYHVQTGEPPRTARLLADGQEVDSGTAEYWGSSTLRHGATEIEAQWGARNSITACRLVERLPGDDGEERVAKTPLDPPPGSRGARRDAFARNHPVLFVMRRVGVAGLEVIVGILGIGAVIGALFGSLLPRLDLAWLPRPSLPDWLPEVSVPGWLRYADPLYWLSRLGVSWPDLPSWIESALDHKKYWLPLVIALFVALGELDRRRKQARQRAERDVEAHDD